MNIEFISYDGKYPSLCHGTLVIKINDKTIGFTYGNKHKTWNAKYPPFWCSGGHVRFKPDWSDYEVIKAPWELNALDKNYPKDILEAMPQLIDIMNENVRQGCCGGCV